MKTVYLVRHGKAAGRELNIPDFERTLTDRGIKDSLAIGRRLLKKGINPSMIVSSPALRALQTARIVAKQLDFNKKNIIANKDLYEQEDGGLLNILHGLGDEHETIMLVGHNPSFAEFAHFLSGFAKEFPTGGVVGIRCNVDAWKEVGIGTGKEISYIIPGTASRETDYTVMKKEIQKSLIESIEHVLSAFNPEPVRKVIKSVEECAQEIAKRYVKQLKKISRSKK